MRKKIDARIRTMVENCVKLRQRGLFVIIGDKAREQVSMSPCRGTGFFTSPRRAGKHHLMCHSSLSKR